MILGPGNRLTTDMTTLIPHAGKALDTRLGGEVRVLGYLSSVPDTWVSDNACRVTLPTHKRTGRTPYTRGKLYCLGRRYAL